MSDENAPTMRFWAALGVGCILTLVGVLWLLALTFGGDNNETATISAQRPGPSATAASPTVGIPAEASPTVVSPTVVSATDGATAEASPSAVATSDVAPTPMVSPTATPTAAPSTPEPTATVTGRGWGSPLLLNSDLGTGSREFSAITLNESTNRIMIADDEGRLFEFDLTANGEPVTPPRHIWRVDVGGGDIEGLAWMFDSTYVLAHENDGRLTVVEIDDTSATITGDDLIRTIDTGIREDGGNGLEGVSYIADGDIEFVVVDERPPSILLIDRSGNVRPIAASAIDLSDVSDIWVDGAGNLVVLSDEDRIVVTMELDASTGLTPIGELELTFGQGRFEQPEGVVGSADGSRLFVVGEDPGPQRFSFGVWPATG